MPFAVGHTWSWAGRKTALAQGFIGEGGRRDAWNELHSRGWRPHETKLQREQAVKLIQGNASNYYNDLREKLIKSLSYIEAKIDFTEEDLPKNIISEIKKISNTVLSEIKKTLNDQKVGERIREGFKIAIVGPPNSGKSSLLNYLSKRDAAIVSEIAGTTRDAIEVNLNIAGFPVIITDTAGLRNSTDKIEKLGIDIASVSYTHLTLPTKA